MEGQRMKQLERNDQLMRRTNVGGDKMISLYYKSKMSEVKKVSYDSQTKAFNGSLKCYL